VSIEKPSRVPLVPAGYVSRYREVTLAAVVFAIVIGVVMNAAITYAGLKIGFTIGGSAIAAVLGFGVLRGLLRRGTILETNIAQTVASAVNTSNAGVIFTVPVLFLIGYELAIDGPDFWLITLACICGAYLGTAFIIPLRKQMLDIERLRFPSPTGVATILKSPGAGPAKAVVLLIGIVLGAAVYLPVALPSLVSEAELGELDALVAAEKITAADAERTRNVDGWIIAETVPQAVLERGRALDELRRARTDLERFAARLSRAVAAGRSPETVESMSAELVEKRRHIVELESALAEHPADGLHGDELVVAAAQAAAGEIPWSDLRSRTLGWAEKPLFGYSDLDVRLPEERELADGEEPGPLTVRVDRDRNDRPDLLVTDQMVDVGRWVGLFDEYQWIFAIAPFALGAGFITGRAGLFVLAGGILAFFVLNPIAFQTGWMPETIQAHQAAGYGFAAFNRPLGIGLLLGGAFMGVVASAPGIREALKSIAFAGRSKGGADELRLSPIVIVILIALAALFAVTDVMGGKPLNDTCPVTQQEIDPDVEPLQESGYAIAFASEDAKVAWSTEWSDAQRGDFLAEHDAKPGWLAAFSPTVRAILIAIIGTVWIWFAGIIIAQCAGMTDWSPISGMALLTIVLVMLLAGTGAVVTAVLVGAALCVAITLAADMMGDLKTGYLVGSIPRRQQMTELLVVWIGPVVCMLTLWIIVQANLKQGDIPIGPGTATVAPQAQALQAVMTGVQGGEMPYALYGVGAVLGALLGLGAFAGLGVLVGLSMYLPFQYIATYGVGCIVNIVLAWIAGLFLGRARGKAWTEEWGVPLAAGLIVGESILALLINIVVLARG
jgi:uncharacterized oligopeptide transporter (OPT) family protein